MYDEDLEASIMDVYEIYLLDEVLANTTFRDFFSVQNDAVKYDSAGGAAKGPKTFAGGNFNVLLKNEMALSLGILARQKQPGR